MKLYLLSFIPLSLIFACSSSDTPAAAAGKDATGNDAATDAAADISPSPSDCSPQNTGTCSNSPTATMCCPVQGNIYVWDAATQCRVLLHAAASQTPFDCMDTGSPASKDNACMGYAALTCYEKNTSDGKHLVMLSTSEWPESYLLLSPWKKCTFELYTQVDQAPDCT